jgi:hypothetical protein
MERSMSRVVSLGLSDELNAELSAWGFALERVDTVMAAAHTCAESPARVLLVSLQVGAAGLMGLMDSVRQSSSRLVVLAIGTVPASAWRELFLGGADELLPAEIDPKSLAARVEYWATTSVSDATVVEEPFGSQATPVPRAKPKVSELQAFEHRLAQEFARARRYDHPLAVLVVRCAESPADQVDTVYSFIEKELRSFDFMVKLEAQLLAVVLPFTALSGALVVLQRIALRKSARQLPALFCGASAVPHPECETPEALLSQAVQNAKRAEQDDRAVCI